MKITTCITAAILCCILTAQAETKPFAEPILLTSCGQSADALMMKTMLMRDSLTFEYLPSATAADVSGKGSLLLVVGGSSKGLGAAKISAEDESARVAALLDAARKAEIPVLAVHLGGQARRGALSDPFNQMGVENAQYVIVVKGGNEDGFFSKIAESKSIPIETAGTALGVSPLVVKVYRP
jgi:hypothetical protein